MSSTSRYLPENPRADFTDPSVPQKVGHPGTDFVIAAKELQDTLAQMYAHMPTIEDPKNAVLVGYVCLTDGMNLLIWKGRSLLNISN